MMDLETKQYLNRIYGRKLVIDDKEKLKENFHSGETHAYMVKTKDTALCMYDYAKEILDITEGYADTDSAK